MPPKTGNGLVYRELDQQAQDDGRWTGDRVQDDRKGRPYISTPSNQPGNMCVGQDDRKGRPYISDC
jgi:hypothetical protein